MAARRAAGNAGALMLYRKVQKDPMARNVLVPGPQLIATNDEIDEWLQEYNQHFTGAVKFQVPFPPLARGGGRRGVTLERKTISLNPVSLPPTHTQL